MRIERRIGLALAAIGYTFPALASHPTALPLEPYRKGVAVRVEANGRKGLFTLDTAGGLTVISPAFARAIGCTPWGRITGFQMSGDRLTSQRCDNVALQVAGLSLRLPVVSVLDVAPLIAKGAAPIDGSLALDAFAGRTVTIDFAAGQLVLETTASLRRRLRGARAVPIHLLREIGGRALTPVVDVPTTSGTLRFELDSGNGGTLLVAKPYAQLFGLDPDATRPQPARIPIVPGIAAQGLAFTPDLIIDGNLGMPFLKDWVVTLDLARGRMWLKRSAATPPPTMGAPPAAPRS